MTAFLAELSLKVEKNDVHNGYWVIFKSNVTRLLTWSKLTGIGFIIYIQPEFFISVDNFNNFTAQIKL